MAPMYELTGVLETLPKTVFDSNSLVLPGVKFKTLGALNFNTTPASFIACV